jgi:hypothetical protein
MQQTRCTADGHNTQALRAGAQTSMHALASWHAYCHASDDKHSDMHMPQARGSVSGCIHVSTPHKPCKWVGCLHKSLLLLLAAPLLLLAARTVATRLVAGQCMAV